jgi:hypothetical protein
MTDQKQLEDVEYLKYLGSMITNDTNVLSKLNRGLSWQKQHSTIRRRLSQLAIWTTFRSGTDEIFETLTGNNKIR